LKFVHGTHVPFRIYLFLLLLYFEAFVQVNYMLSKNK
jgi:hypothetical protein